MPLFTKFSITLDPNNLTNLSKATHDAFDNIKNPFSNDGIQITSVAQTFNLTQQAKLVQNPDAAQYILAQAIKQDTYLRNDDEDSIKNSPENIYGKINKLKQNEKEKVLEDYRKNSIKDSGRLNNLYLKIGNEVIDTNKDKSFLKKVAHKYNNKYIKDINQEEIKVENVTMDMVVDYIQDNYNVLISDEQRNVLKTQCNQAGIAGSTAAFTQTNAIVPDTESKANSKIIFIFDKDKKLDKIDITENLKGYFQEEQRTATSKISADVSNLKSNKKSASRKETTLEDYLPKYSPKSVKIEYESKDLPLNISAPLHKVMKDCGVFEGTQYNKLKNFMQKKCSSLLTSFSNAVSGKKQQQGRGY